ncbi:MAG: protein kinase [Myxococcales bacterium]|nr:protein kinase [Myxococcales bacterium]
MSSTAARAESASAGEVSSTAARAESASASEASTTPRAESASASSAEASAPSWSASAARSASSLVAAALRERPPAATEASTDEQAGVEDLQQTPVTGEVVIRADGKLAHRPLDRGGEAGPRAPGVPMAIDRSHDATPPVPIRALEGEAESTLAARGAGPRATDEAAGGEASSEGEGGNGEPVPAQISRFTVLQRLGSGGMGVVYAAYDPELDRRVALKVLRAQVSQSSSSSTARARLLREAKALAKLSHPNVVAIYDVGTIDDQVFIAMEFVKGMTLTEWTRQPPEPLADGSQPARRAWQDVLGIFLQAGRGLAAAHKAGIIHRDFKPDNVLIGRDGRVRVVDFGLARADSNHPERPDTFADAIKSVATESSSVFELKLTRPGGMAGTPAYMAPEQYANLQVDARTDQFSFCVALYEGLYGERPFLGNTVARVRKAVLNGKIAPEPKDSNVPQWLRKILIRGLAVHPGARYPSMDALLAELSDDPGRPQRSWLRVGLVAVAILLIGAFGYAQLRGQSEGRLLDGPSCEDEARPLAEAFGVPRRAALADAFAATGLADAGATWRRVEDLLTEMTRDWTRTHGWVCTIGHLHGDTSSSFVDLQRSCLIRRLGPLRALTDALGEISPTTLGAAVPAAHALLALTPCADPSSLRARVDEPAAGELADLGASLRLSLDRASAAFWLGRIDEALTMSRQVTNEASHVDHLAVRAEAYLLQGTIEEASGDYDAADRNLKEALWHAEASRHDEVAVDSLTHLVRVLGVHLRRDEEVEQLSLRLTAAVRRLGDRRRDARAHHSLGLAAAARGHHEAAIVRLENAVETASKIGGSHGRLLGAEIMVDLGRFARGGRARRRGDRGPAEGGRRLRGVDGDQPPGGGDRDPRALRERGRPRRARSGAAELPAGARAAGRSLGALPPPGRGPLRPGPRALRVEAQRRGARRGPPRPRRGRDERARAAAQREDRRLAARPLRAMNMS